MSSIVVVIYTCSLVEIKKSFMEKGISYRHLLFMDIHFISFLGRAEPSSNPLMDFIVSLECNYGRRRTSIYSTFIVFSWNHLKIVFAIKKIIYFSFNWKYITNQLILRPKQLPKYILILIIIHFTVENFQQFYFN